MRNISQSKVLQKSNKSFIFLLSLIMLAFIACESSTEQKNTAGNDNLQPNFKRSHGQLIGEEKALEKVDKMLAALGGREKWQNLKSINYREKRDQKGIDTTYSVETWIDLENFNSRTEQKGTKFHTFISINDKNGKVYDLNRNRSVNIRPKERHRFHYEYKHNMYRIIKQLAMGDKLHVTMRNKDRFDVMNRDTLMGGFNLNAQGLPEYFGSQIYMEGKTEKIIHFTGWKTDGDVPFPLDGETLDHSMTFIMDNWEAYMQPTDMVFPELDSLITN